MNAPIVSTQAGPVRGRFHDGIENFVEVPYAAAPVGPLRFKPPQPLYPWAEVRPADRWRYRTPQLPARSQLRTPKKYVAMLGEPYAPGMAEDSLTLNIWTPSSTDGARRPVLFFIHGGLYALGQAGQPAYDGESLARRHDVVFVSVTHRVNAFGFLYLDPIAGADYRGSGNAGLLDLVAALEWVRDNIAVFGGDPGSVTIAGESGGAAQVSLLMIMEQAKGLFHRAVCESGFAFSVKAPETAERYAARLIAELGGSDVSAAVSASMQGILAAQERIAAKDRDYSPMYIGPVLDGVVFSQPPGQVWDSGHGSAVPLLAGWTLDEVATFSRQDISASIPVPGMFRSEHPKELEGGLDVSADGGLGAVSSWAGGDAAGVIAARRALFPAESDTVLARRLVSDIQFRRPAERAAVARDAAGSATYLYRFEWASPVMYPLGAPHCAGIAPFFANEQLVAFTRDNSEARALAETMSSALAAFMRTGDPSTGGLKWAPYQADNRAVMIFDRESRVVLDPERTVRLALDELSPRWVV
ncbi:MAG TPA: carboxylesterase family protein [Trebonia sp.]|nr:carboxylesterase family protein [Trebonia sp.]